MVEREGLRGTGWGGEDAKIVREALREALAAEIRAGVSAQITMPKAREVSAALDRLEARIADYENAITWGCSSVAEAHYLDKNYSMYMKIEELKAALREIAEKVGIPGWEFSTANAREIARRALGEEE